MTHTIPSDTRAAYLHARTASKPSASPFGSVKGAKGVKGVTVLLGLRAFVCILSSLQSANVLPYQPPGTSYWDRYQTNPCTYAKLKAEACNMCACPPPHTMYRVINTLHHMDHHRRAKLLVVRVTRSARCSKVTRQEELPCARVVQEARAT